MQWFIVYDRTDQRMRVCVQGATTACGATGLECVLYNNIYKKVVNRPAAVHAMATGLGTTSQEMTREWLMTNVLRGTDEFSFQVATNMTALVRENFGIDDRISKAWFVNPGNRWNVPLRAGTQSSLLLTDKLILFAVITLNDGSGNVMRRRMLSFSPSAPSSPITIHGDREMAAAYESNGPRVGRALLSLPPIPTDDSLIENALQQIQLAPRVGALPTLDYQVDLPFTVAQIFGVEKRKYALLTISMQGRTAATAGVGNAESVGNEFYRRLNENKDKFCPSCEGIFPVFNNIRVSDSSTGRRRALLQTGSSVDGTYTILLVYDPSMYNTNISFAGMSMAVYNPDYTPVWAGSSNQADIAKFIDGLKSNQFVVTWVNSTNQ